MTRSPIELFWTAKNKTVKQELRSIIWFERELKPRKKHIGVERAAMPCFMLCYARVKVVPNPSGREI